MDLKPFGENPEWITDLRFPTQCCCARLPAIINGIETFHSTTKIQWGIRLWKHWQNRTSLRPLRVSLEDGNPSTELLLTTRRTVIHDCCHSSSGTRNYKDPTKLVRGIDTGNSLSDLDRKVTILFRKVRALLIKTESFLM